MSEPEPEGVPAVVIEGRTAAPTRAEVEAWTVDDVCAWLGSLKLPAGVIEKFRDNEVDNEELLDEALDRTQLLDQVGVTKLSHRKKILVGMQMIRCLEPEPEPEPEPETYYTCLDLPAVQQQLRLARSCGKNVVVVFEEERRRAGHFDFGKAHAKYKGGEWEFVLGIEAIRLPRGTHEAEAMVARMLAKSGLAPRAEVQLGAHPDGAEVVASALHEAHGDGRFFVCSSSSDFAVATTAALRQLFTKQELSSYKTHHLKRYARASGISCDAIDDADDSVDPKAALMEIISAATLAADVAEDPEAAIKKCDAFVLFLTSEPDPEAEPRPPLPRPKPFGDLQPGRGEAVAGQTELHPFVGEHRPKIRETNAPAEGWAEMLQTHTDFYVQDVIVPTHRLPGRAFDQECSRRYDACHHFLATWPYGSGAGELLAEPIIDATPPRQRGVRADWWLAVASRAAFVPTRIFVEAFVKPVTKAAQCALWFFIPEVFRARPDPPHGVFVSHAWDLSMWDIRPEPDSIVWLDTLAIVQHPVLGPGGAKLPADEAYIEIRDLVPTVEAISNTLLILGGGGGISAAPLLPLARSWCCYEIAHTPKGKLRVRVGWSTWELKEQQQIRLEIDAMDMAKAEAFDPKDKQMIDELVQQKLGSFEKANAVIKDSVLRGYFGATSDAYQVAPTANGSSQQASITELESRIDAVSSDGQRPLLDRRIVQLFAGGWMDDADRAKLEELVRAQSLAEWAQEQREKSALLAEPMVDWSGEQVLRWIALIGLPAEQVEIVQRALAKDEIDGEELVHIKQRRLKKLLWRSARQSTVADDAAGLVWQALALHKAAQAGGQLILAPAEGVPPEPEPAAEPRMPTRAGSVLGAEDPTNDV
eukprot:COSAG01_NODE_5425_length_4271_cov_24.200623_1_plen_872_part_00